VVLQGYVDPYGEELLRIERAAKEMEEKENRELKGLKKGDSGGR